MLTHILKSILWAVPLPSGRGRAIAGCRPSPCYGHSLRSSLHIPTAPATIPYATSILIYLLCLTHTVGAQQAPTTNQKEKIKLEHADELVFDDNFSKARRLRGNVQFSQGAVHMFCDSAYFYDESNVVDAYENVRIEKGTQMQIVGRFLHYDGNTKLAVIKNNVRLTDNKMTLTTDVLDYDMNTETGYYLNSARIQDNQNTLTSLQGNYNSNTKMLAFKKKCSAHQSALQAQCRYITLQHPYPYSILCWAHHHCFYRSRQHFHLLPTWLVQYRYR